LGAPAGGGTGAGVDRTSAGGSNAGGTDAGGTDAGGTDAGGTEPGAGLVVDSLGKRCPIPVIELAKVIGEVPVGGLVTVLSDDEAARLDIPAWCAMREQEYVGERPAERGAAYVVRRRV
jgi:cysteine desulfurase